MKTLVLNQSYEPIGIYSDERSFILVWLGKADLIESHETPIKSARAEWQRPSVIRLRKGTRFNPHKIVEMSRKNIFRRDGFKCVYCGSKDSLTVDHVLPKSRGGSNRWENVVTACHKCNNKKDDWTPEELGWTLRQEPKRPHHVIFMGHQTMNIHDNWKPYLFLD